MADNVPGDVPEQDLDEPKFPVLPPREAIPPPPEMTYQRPLLGPADRGHSSQNDASGVSGHGAGMAAGTMFVASIVGGALAGNYIDGRWIHAGTPWATVVLTLLGAVSGFINMQRILSRADRNNKP